MSGIRLSAAAFVAAFFFWAWPSAGQAQANVALVDINQVFDSHPAFKAGLEKLRADAEALQASVVQKRQQLQAQAEQLALVYAQGSAEFAERDKQLALESARIDLDARDKMRELTRREARLHYDVYSEVTRIIEAWCKETSTQLVIRFNARPVQENDPDSIMTAVNAAVVWHRADRDATPAILQRIARQVPAAGTPGR